MRSSPYSLFALIFHIYVFHGDQSSLCGSGCELLFHEDLPCDLKHAMVPNEYINDSGGEVNLQHILSESAYLCVNLNLGDTVHVGTDPSAAGSLSLNSYVFLWQSIVIAIVIPP